jgi:hypothetical protein
VRDVTIWVEEFQNGTQGLKASSDEMPATRPSKGRSSTALSASYRGRAALQRRVRAQENGTESRRDALEKADDVLPHPIFLRHPSPFHGDSVVASTHRPFIVNTDRHFVNQIQSMADRD